MHFKTILEENQQKLLPYFKKLPALFYLAGGTGIALQLGHRFSYDFDFFCEEEFDTHRLYTALVQDVLSDIKLTIIQESLNTLDVLTESNVKISFIRYRYKRIYPVVQTEYFPIADLRDIAAMKIIASAQRSTQKDYYDIYFLLNKFTLKKLFETAEQKYPSFNPLIYLKALTYFDECDTLPPRLFGCDVDFEIVKTRLIAESHSLFDYYRKKQ